MKQNSAIKEIRKRLLIKEIRHKVKLKSKLSNQYEKLKASFKLEVSILDFYYLIQYIKRNTRSKCQEIKEKHRNKTKRLRLKQKEINKRFDPDTVISNFSSYNLNETEKSALTRGLKFSIPPKKIKKGDYLCQFEKLYREIDNEKLYDKAPFDKTTFQTKLKDIAMSSFYAYNTKDFKRSNLPKEEMDALRNLQSNKDILILKPDKGSGIILLDHNDYISKMNDILKDATKFKEVNNRDEYQQCRYGETRLRKYLLELKNAHIIDINTYKSLYPNGSNVGILYGSPKLKDNVPLRPICSAIGTSSYKLSKYLVDIITPVSMSSKEKHIVDSFDFINKIDKIKINEYKMVSFDVKNLFTNVPLELTIDICCERLYHSTDETSKPNIPEIVFRELLTRATTEFCFKFNNKLYVQVDGISMGNPLGPAIANVFMSYLENKYMKNYHSHPTHYFRYMDDILCFFRDEKDIDSFHLFINSLHENIKFEPEYEKENKMEFLDLTIIKEFNTTSPITTCRERKTHKGLYFHFESFIPFVYKINLVKSLVFRVYSTCSGYTNMHACLTKLTEKLVLNGFPKNIICDTINSVLTKVRFPTQTLIGPKKKEVSIILPFLGNNSLAVKKRLNNLFGLCFPHIDLKIIFKKTMTLSNLFPFKDRIEKKCRSHIVYQAICEQCSCSYRGKTVNSLYERFYLSPSGHLNSKCTDSRLIEHCLRDVGHNFQFEDVKIIDSAENDYDLKIKESIYIKFDSVFGDLNVDETSIDLKLF